MKIHKKALVLLAVQLTALAGHAEAAGSSQPPADRQIVDLPINFIWTDGKELPLALRPLHLYLGVALIPGSFHANGTLSYLDTRPIGHDTSIAWDLGRLSGKFARKATSATATAAPEFAVTPQEARLARLLPGLWFPARRDFKAKEGFYDAATRNTLLLVYFDRPCHVTGTDTGRQNPALESPPQIDIQVDAPGWVWIEIRKTGPSTYVEDRVPAPHPVLLITPADEALFRRAQEGTPLS